MNRLAITSEATLYQALNKLNETGEGFICVVDDAGRLLGVLTDGDARRAIIKGIPLETGIEKVANKDFIYWEQGRDSHEALNFMKFKKLRHLPVIDPYGVLIDVLLMDNVEFNIKDNIVVLMAGGTGKRLRPLTENTPKPMLKIGNKPFLEYILEDLTSQGFHTFYFSVNYLASQIKAYFKDGSTWGVKVNYINEKMPLGTAGALALLPKELRSELPLIVMNGDLVTKVDFGLLLESHKEKSNVATMCVYEHAYQVPFGVVEIDKEDNMIGIDEKPVQKFLVNAGIYALEWDCLRYIPKNKEYDLPLLFKRLLHEKKKVGVFPIYDYWLDVGRPEDYEKAKLLG